MQRAEAVSGLFTDLYELTMAQAYLAQGDEQQAVFELYFRRLPKRRRYVVAAGLDDVLEFLTTLRFSPEEVDYVRSLGGFSGSFLEWLAHVRFTGDVWAMPEGTLVFPNEPIVQVIAPVAQAQLVETLILNQVHLQSVMASKAARIVEAARGRDVVEFGARRAHGTDAAVKVARAAYLVGAVGTSNVLAARRYQMPAFGTMAHSFVQAFEDERVAFEVFNRMYPGTTLLVDTYDTLRGIEKVIEMAKHLGEAFRVYALRLDSGDLGRLSRDARRALDAAGLHQVRLFASSSLDEYRIAELLDAQSPIDAFGVGTRLAVAEDEPSLDVAYKLVEYAGSGRTKLSSDKLILPGRKQVYRRFEGGFMVGDSIAAWGEPMPGEPLLVPVMQRGRRLPGRDGLETARRHARAQLAALPPDYRGLESGEPYPVTVSATIMEEVARLRRAHH